MIIIQSFFFQSVHNLDITFAIIMLFWGNYILIDFINNKIE